MSAGSFDLSADIKCSDPQRIVALFPIRMFQMSRARSEKFLQTETVLMWSKISHMGM